MPVAHGDGNYFADDETLDAAGGRRPGRLPLLRADGTVDGSGNPNGSIRNIAGIFNETQDVLGLMPHPGERRRAAARRHATAGRCSKG